MAAQPTLCPLTDWVTQIIRNEDGNSLLILAGDAMMTDSAAGKSGLLCQDARLEVPMGLGSSVIRVRMTFGRLTGPSAVLESWLACRETPKAYLWFRRDNKYASPVVLTGVQVFSAGCGVLCGGMAIREEIVALAKGFATTEPERGCPPANTLTPPWAVG